ncbi:MAG: hypothetical protein Q7U03_01790 [Syntrophales bacterium]|nr:hypothetical protein [Syntrophales bacterium]
MVEKLGAAVVIVATVAALGVIKMLNLPVFVTALFAFVGVIICLVGIVFVFSEGTILTSARRQAKSIPQVGKTLKETAS